jgi:5,10-methylene-tetrahydrofolate dehydrogenase/methenyl tetrahydrofolate cyclohydrolase
MDPAIWLDTPPNAEENVFHFTGVPGGVARMTATPHMTNMLATIGIKNLRK